MDLSRVIRELKEERKHLDRIIESLETILKTGDANDRPPSRRGRKFMDSSDRKEVSERMKNYWARRREEKALAGSANAENGPSGTERARPGLHFSNEISLAGERDRSVFAGA